MARKTPDRAAAEAVIEQLRFGVPPADRIREFTVGRDDQLTELEASLEAQQDGRGSALLVRANYGAGKTHLLKVIREMALDSGYAVSLVEVNAQEGVRFNRMDTMFGAISRGLEVPGCGERGIGSLFELFAGGRPAKLNEDAKAMRAKISSNGRWDHSEFLKSPPLYIALRAWIHGDDDSRRLITDWLANPQNYRGQRRLLYDRLVASLRQKFRDPRADWQFYAEDVFMFHTSGHRHSWDAVADLHTVSKASGLRGLVLLFDEFEDVITNLNRRDLQEQAFLNLFRFFIGDRFPGMVYFAVTPDFVQKCKVELLSRGMYDFDYKRFDGLNYFELDTITEGSFLSLAQHIRAMHGAAYEWNAAKALPDPQLLEIVADLWSVTSPEKVRRATKGVVDELDRRLET